MHYSRNDFDFARGTFRVRGDVVDIIPAYETQTAIRIEMFGDEIEKLSYIESVTGKVMSVMDSVVLFRQNCL